MPGKLNNQAAAEGSFPDFPSKCDLTFHKVDAADLQSALQKKPDAESMRLGWCEKRDWAVLSQFTALRKLLVHCWKHPDLEPLRPLRALEHLVLDLYGSIADDPSAPARIAAHVELFEKLKRQFASQ